MTKTIIFSLLLTPLLSYSQKHLPNLYSSFSQVYGGMEDGGISITESYIFVAKKKVQLTDFRFQNELLELDKGDSLIVNLRKYKAYKKSSEASIDSPTEKPKKIPELKLYSGVYYLNISETHSWDGSVNYCFRKKCFVSPIKEEFDTKRSDYAP